MNVTAHPTADWIAQQITEAFPWDEAPRYLIRDRDGVYGAVVTRRLRAMGIRDKPISAGSPWQNCYAERLIGTIRRECVDHLIVLGGRRQLKDHRRRPRRLSVRAAFSGHRPPLQFSHCHVGFDRVGNETILVSGVVHFIELFRTGPSIPAPRDLRA